MANLALFDFDHTLYAKDSLLEFTKQYSKKNFYTGLAVLSPWLVGLKIGLLNNERVKVKFFTHFFAGEDYTEFIKNGQSFSSTQIQESINSSIFQNFQKHIADGDQVVIVTASAAEWIKPWSMSFGVTVIGTKLQVKNNKLTGKFDSPNCYGIEKTNRIKGLLDVSEFEKITVYGSGKGDAEMLKLQTPL